MSDTNQLDTSTQPTEHPVGENLEDSVKTTQFDRECSTVAYDHVSSSGRNGNSYNNKSNTDRNSSSIALESDPHEPSKVEAHCYYAGLRSYDRGPKLIYRDSSDVYELPFGPERYKRLMRLVAVPDDHAFGKDCLWDRVRDKVVELLCAKDIKLTCVDFVRFTWKDDDTYISYITNPTIWIGAAPGTLTATAAFDATKDIRAFVDGLGLKTSKIDIAYREAVPAPLSGPGPPLFPPSEYFEPLMEVVDNVSVALSLPISGLETGIQGTMGPYFHAGDRLFAIATRHNLFSDKESNEEYRYHESGPKKLVVLMSEPAFTNYLVAIHGRIQTLLRSIKSFESWIDRQTDKVRDKIDLPDSQTRLESSIAEVAKLRRKLDVFEGFYTTIKKEWNEIEQRIIGFVVWAPPIGVGAAPQRYTSDICVVELYKDKFTHFLGNALSLGAESMYAIVTLGKLLGNGPRGVPPLFEYRDDGLLPLQSILTAERILNPDTDNPHGNPLRRVLKRGFATDTTVGTVTRYMSFVRKYLPTGHLDSLELPIIPHEKETGTFAKSGDSGSIIVSPRGEYVSLLTSGTNQGTEGSDITYSTMFEWLWKLVLAEFPGASLHWDDIPAFLAPTAV